MGLYSSRLEKGLTTFFLALLLFALVGCSSVNNTPQTPLESQMSSEQIELEDLKNENGRLREELEAAITELEESRSKIDELEAELSAAKDELIEKLEQLSNTNTEVRYEKEGQLNEPESATLSNPMDDTSPQLTLEESVLGEWFYEQFIENGYWSRIQSMILYADGTGVINQVYYMPESDAEINREWISQGLEVTIGDRLIDFSWSLADNMIHIETEEGEIVDFVYWVEEEKLSFTDGSWVHVRQQLPAEKYDGYVAHSTFAPANEALKAKEDEIKRPCIGVWCFDILNWTFNEDGTGCIDIPEVGDQPASKVEFSYTIEIDTLTNEVGLIVIEWDDSGTSYYWPKFNSDGSMTLEGAAGSKPIKLTRQFDPDNCPITQQLMSNMMGVLTGTIVRDFLGGE